MPPIICTSKWRMPSVRFAASRTVAKASGRMSSSVSPASSRARNFGVCAFTLVALRFHFGLGQALIWRRIQDRIDVAVVGRAEQALGKCCRTWRFPWIIERVADAPHEYAEKGLLDHSEPGPSGHRQKAIPSARSPPVRRPGRCGGAALRGLPPPLVVRRVVRWLVGVRHARLGLVRAFGEHDQRTHVIGVAGAAIARSAVAKPVSSAKRVSNNRKNRPYSNPTRCT